MRSALSLAGRGLLSIRQAPRKLRHLCWQTLKPHLPLRIRAGHQYHYFPEDLELLEMLRLKGFMPATIFDIGASTGAWAECVTHVFPRAQFHLFEPLAEQVEFYRQDLAERIPALANLHMHPVALGAENEGMKFHVATDAYGSSPLDRGDIAEVQRSIHVAAHRLDDYANRQGLPLPDIMKLDCQGGESAVLDGAPKCLAHAAVLIMETWLIRGYGPDTPLLSEMVQRLEKAGFNLIGLGSRAVDTDGRVYGMDAYFFATKRLPLEVAEVRREASTPEEASRNDCALQSSVTDQR